MTPWMVLLGVFLLAICTTAIIMAFASWTTNKQAKGNSGLELKMAPPMTVKELRNCYWVDPGKATDKKTHTILARILKEEPLQDALDKCTPFPLCNKKQVSLICGSVLNIHPDDLKLLNCDPPKELKEL